jgi:hypothetical protein
LEVISEQQLLDVSGNALNKNIVKVVILLPQLDDAEAPDVNAMSVMYNTYE